MKHEIQTAYNKAAPDPETAARIRTRVLNRTEIAEPRRSRSSLPRRLILIAAAAAALALLASGGYAAYRQWRLPEPERYEAPSDGGFYQVRETAVYSLGADYSPETVEPDGTARPGTPASADVSVQTDPVPTNGDGPEAPTQTDAPVQTEPAAPTVPPTEPDAAPAPLSDEAFIRHGLALLRQVGVLEATPETLTVVRQENLYWGREEAELLFDQGELRVTVKYDANTGKFLGLSGIDWQPEGSAACADDAEAEALARRCYEALPVEQGYELIHVEKYDAQYWSYEFCREAAPGIFNQYEMVRVAVNPVSGRLTGCTVFYVPLLDDHEPGQERISQAQAEQVVRDCPYLSLEGRVLTDVRVEIAFPNWMFTEYGDVIHRRASDVTRWAWILTYERPDSEYADKRIVYVDCYTGEILGGDAV